MAIRSFNITNQRALRRAECASVPKLMLIAGPNGVGKSTLLSCIHQGNGTQTDPNTRILYQPPHRVIRRQKVQRRYLGGQIKSVTEALAGNELSGYDGLNIPYPRRALDNVDETGSTIKYSLGKMENRRQMLLATRVDRHHSDGTQFDVAVLPKVYEPLQKLISRLLPHLEFKKLDFANEDDIKCVFVRTDSVGAKELDLDDLSSGEKAVILLFLPVIEFEISSRLNQLDPQHVVRPEQPVVFVIDEPEQHLHPELQQRVLAYLREQVVNRTGIIGARLV